MFNKNHVSIISVTILKKIFIAHFSILEEITPKVIN